nr:hypothetical protein 33 [bacterium]
MIYVGERITLKATFTDSEGTNVDPTTPVTVTVIKPDGTVDVDVDGETASTTGTGVFTYVYTPDTQGRYQFIFESADDAIEKETFIVRRRT